MVFTARGMTIHLQKNSHMAKKQVQQHKDKNTNLIRTKLVQKQTQKSKKEHKKCHKIMLYELNM